MVGNHGRRAVTLTISAQYTLPDSTSRASVFRTWDFAPASEKYFFTNRLCSLFGRTRAGAQYNEVEG